MSDQGLDGSLNRFDAFHMPHGKGLIEMLGISSFIHTVIHDCGRE
jgi:hypothetical protein